MPDGRMTPQDVKDAFDSTRELLSGVQTNRDKALERVDGAVNEAEMRQLQRETRDLLAEAVTLLREIRDQSVGGQ